MNNKRYLITGGTGSFGKTMLMQLLTRTDTESVRILSRDEEKQDALRNQLKDPRVQFQIGDVRDRSSVDTAVRGVNFVFHAAALKQVPSCEFFPMQAVMTNINGSENVIRAGVAEGVSSIVCLSTDKAVFPVNAMGMTKAMMEKVAQAAARELGTESATTVSCVRYGNVMMSRGSVIPLFLKQVRENRPITITVPEMTRFLMPLSQSVTLVEYAFEQAKQGDLFIRKAAACTLMHMANAILQLANVDGHEVEIIGWRHGEKLYETLASAQELSTAEDLDDYWRIRTDLRDLNYANYFTEGDQSINSGQDFHSHNAQQLDIEQCKELLLSVPEFTDALSS